MAEHTQRVVIGSGGADACIRKSDVGRRIKMMDRETGSNPMLLIWAFLFLYPLNAFAGEPTVQIKSTVDQVIQILTNTQLQGEGRKQERRKRLREVIFARFDFQEMAQRSLGAHWQRRTPEEQTEFIKVFSDLLEQTYVDKIESYNNEKFIYANERIDGPYAEVSSKMRTSKGEEFTINYKLHRMGEDWRVYDLVIENISLINNYRSQFNRILTSSTYDELILRIKAKLSDKREQVK
jgi:phospholipid transport system substrate-binding protein